MSEHDDCGHTEEEHDTFRLAHDKLQAAIAEFVDTMEPNIFLDDWVLTVHKQSTELDAAGQSSIGVVATQGQFYHRTIGLMQAGLDQVKSMNARGGE